MNLYLNLALRAAIVTVGYAGVRYCLHRSYMSSIKKMPQPNKPSLSAAA
jgi:hypothetical protein